MSCDIHAFLEANVGDKWVCLDQIPFVRSYLMFSKLANVRSDGTIPSISDPRGLPDNISDVVSLHLDKWGDDAHSASWLAYDELVDFVLWMNEQKDHG